MIVLTEIGNKLIKEIADRLESKNINNVGTASSSLKVESTENSLKIKGVGYIRFLDVGRRPGKFAPPEVIQEWVRTKLGITEPKENKSVAFLINRKLKVEGSRIYLDNSKGLQLKEIVEMGKNLIQEAIPRKMKIKITSQINKLLEV